MVGFHLMKVLSCNSRVRLPNTMIAASVTMCMVSKRPCFQRKCATCATEATMATAVAV